MCTFIISPVDIDLYNLKVVNASDKCITVMWDHPPDVTPGTLTYNVVLRDEKDFDYKWSTPDTQGTVCNLSPGTTYTFKLTSKTTDPSIHTTRARTTTMKVVTSGESKFKLIEPCNTFCNVDESCLECFPWQVIFHTKNIIVTIIHTVLCYGCYESLVFRYF